MKAILSGFGRPICNQMIPLISRPHPSTRVLSLHPFKYCGLRCIQVYPNSSDVKKASSTGGPGFLSLICLQLTPPPLSLRTSYVDDPPAGRIKVWKRVGESAQEWQRKAISNRLGIKFPRRPSQPRVVCSKHTNSQDHIFKYFAQDGDSSYCVGSSNFTDHPDIL